MSFSAINSLNVFLGIGAITLQILSVFTLLMFFFGPKKNTFLDYIEKYFLILGFLISFFSTVFSLVYSEVIGFLACALCWYQRVFLFPQVFLFGTAFWKRSKQVIYFSLPLLLVGFSISIYQTIVYYFGNLENIPCDASGVSCYQRLVSVFGGYISIPTLSLTSFFVMLVLILVVHFYGKRK
ncbi:MAG: disulfide bond formation protein B [Candidatus Paceibacterota bacterium]|jgi:disulfide bond formation protein DsbB